MISTTLIKDLILPPIDTIIWVFYLLHVGLRTFGGKLAKNVILIVCTTSPKACHSDSNGQPPR